MSVRPWMPFYVNDFRIDTLDLKVDEIGVYFTMLCLAWLRKGPLPGDDIELKRMLSRCFAEFHGHTYNRIVPKILGRYFFKDEDGNWRQKRLEIELQKAISFSAKQSQTASKRWATNKNFNGLSDATAMPGSFKEENSVCKDFKASKSEQTASKRAAKQKQNIYDSNENNDLEMPTQCPRARSQSQSHIEENLTILSSTSGSLTGLNGSEKLKPKKEISADKRELIIAVADAWNDLAATYRLAQVEDITRKRQTAILARATDLTSTYGFPNAHAGFNELFQRIRGSPFLRGEVNGFRATFDFAITQSSFTKIMEGTYAANKTQYHR